MRIEADRKRRLRVFNGDEVTASYSCMRMINIIGGVAQGRPHLWRMAVTGGLKRFILRNIYDRNESSGDFCGSMFTTQAWLTGDAWTNMEEAVISMTFSLMADVSERRST